MWADVPPISQELADQCHKSVTIRLIAGNIAYDIVGIKGHGVVAIDTKSVAGLRAH
jgi:hypothetical protein